MRAGRAQRQAGSQLHLAGGHTVVLGSTQPAGVTASTLILAVKPEVRQYRREPTDSIRTVYPVSAVDEPVQYLSGPVPKYPDSLKVRNVSGRVTLRFIVGIDLGTTNSLVGVWRDGKIVYTRDSKQYSH